MERDLIEVILVGDDAAFLESLGSLLERTRQVTVLGRTADGAAVPQMVRARRPMAVLFVLQDDSALAVIRQIRESAPVPLVAICASPRLGVAALAEGALETLPASADVAAVVQSLRLMAEVRVVRRHAARPSRTASRPRRTARRPARQLVAIGASTGGPTAVITLLQQLSKDFSAAILLVQHMPDDYGPAFARWLGESIPLPAILATEGTRPQGGVVLVAPPDRHMILSGDATMVFVDPEGSEPCPSANRLFRSMAKLTPFDRTGILLTGMGRDGAEGLKCLRDGGGHTFAQDRKSSTIFGMPAAAAELHAAEFVLPPERIGEELQLSIMQRPRDSSEC